MAAYLELFVLVASIYMPIAASPGSCARRSYGPRDTCDLPDSRDFMLPMLSPGKMRSVQQAHLVRGQTHNLTTMGLDPPLFEIPGFLSSKECDDIIAMATKQGLNAATQMGAKEQFVGGRDSARWAETTFISTRHFKYIRERIATLTGLTNDLLFESEAFQIGHYYPGGHYHDHYDSQWVRGDRDMDKICCHHTHDLAVTDKCSLCRYITVLMYLNDVEEGGETGFPEIGLAVGQPRLETYLGPQPANCTFKAVAVTPEKGKAILWYNHHVDPKTGWLGSNNFRSMHSGCDVKVGEKWVANVWINVGPYEYRYKPSVYANHWD